MGTNLDHLYNPATGGGQDITALENKVNSLSNIAAKTNIANSFTANQTINGQVKANTFKIETNNKRIVTEMLDYNNKKYARIVFQDGGTNRLALQHNFNDNINEIVGGNIRVGAPTDNLDIANKQYIDGKFNAEEIITWDGNINSTSLSWNRAANFPSAGTYFFIVRIKANNKYNYIYEMFKMENANDTVIGSYNAIDYGNANNDAIQAIPDKGLALAIVDKNVKLVRYGNGHPTSAQIKIFIKKVN